MASENFLAKYATAVTIPLQLYDPATNRLQDTISWAAGDVKLIINGVDQGNTTNLPTLVTGRKSWEIDLTGAEVTGSNIVLEFVDQDGPAFYDDVLTIQTYGNASASIENIPATLASGTIDSAELSNIAQAILKEDFNGLTGEASRSMLNALRYLRNKWSISGTTLTVTKENDTTAAWTASLTTTASADPVTGVDPA